MLGKMIVFSAPSGAGKTSIVKALLEKFKWLEFSVSATSRASRPGETNGIDYFFIEKEEFVSRIERGDFLEWEEVYKDNFYGTLLSEVERIWQKGHLVVFDVDVAGGLNIKKKYSNAVLSIFVMPPSLEILEERLRGRNTESDESLRKRIMKASKELEYAKDFDHIVVNDQLHEAIEEASKLAQAFAGKP